MSTITFGKYKGQPMSVLLNDKPYLKWCQQQSWFQDKYPNLCETSSPSPSPAPVLTESISNKIRRLEEENESLTRQIKHNTAEISRLKQQTGAPVCHLDDDDDACADDNSVRPPKTAGHCLL